MFRYEISGGDGAAYGPAFGPVAAESQFETGSQEFGGQYLVMKLLEPLELEGHQISHLAISMRYAGETLDELPGREATVGIARVLPGGLDSLHSGVNRENVEYFAVGTCRPVQV